MHVISDGAHSPVSEDPSNTSGLKIPTCEINPFLRASNVSASEAHLVSKYPQTDGG